MRAEQSWQRSVLDDWYGLTTRRALEVERSRRPVRPELKRIRREALDELAVKYRAPAARMAEHLASFPAAIEQLQRDHAEADLTDPLIAWWRLGWHFDLEALNSELARPPEGDEINDEPFLEKQL